jgi:hypothetical protein
MNERNHCIYRNFGFQGLEVCRPPQDFFPIAADVASALAKLAWQFKTLIFALDGQVSPSNGRSLYFSSPFPTLETTSTTGSPEEVIRFDRFVSLSPGPARIILARTVMYDDVPWFLSIGDRQNRWVLSQDHGGSLFVDITVAQLRYQNRATRRHDHQGKIRLIAVMCLCENGMGSLGIRGLDEFFDIVCRRLKR